MTLLDPQKSLANLICIGYGHDSASTFSVTRKRSVDRKKQRTERNVFQCFVFGPKKSGKSALLDSFLGRYTSFNIAMYPSYVVSSSAVWLFLWVYSCYIL